MKNDFEQLLHELKENDQEVYDNVQSYIYILSTINNNEKIKLSNTVATISKGYVNYKNK